MNYQASKTIITAIALFLLPFAGIATAADQIAGRVFAAQNCGRCHAVGAIGFSPYAKAPPFRLVASKYKLENLEEALAEGIVTGHNSMPEFILTARQIDNLLAYFETLK